MLKEIDRNLLREIFQPSRIVLAIVKDDINNKWNFLPIAFNMYCGYKPLTFCFAIHDINYSYELLERAAFFSVAIPGEKLSGVTLQSGLESGENIDKFDKFNVTPILSDDGNECLGIRECIANIYCKKIKFLKVSDHALVVGEVIRMTRDFSNDERNLLSISSDTRGYRILEQKCIHRIAIKDI